MKENCIEIKGNSIKGNLDILFYENDGAIIAYAPSLDLMGYGINEEEAKSSFEVVLSNFFHKCLQEGTLDKCLKQCGWKKDGTKEFTSLNLADSASKNRTVRKILSLPRFTKTAHPIRISAGR